MLLRDEDNVVNLTSYERLVFRFDEYTYQTSCYLNELDTDDIVIVSLGGGYEFSHIDGAGMTLLERMRDYEMDPREPLAKHYGRKGWSTYDGTLRGSTQSEWCDVFIATNPNYCTDARSDFKVLQQWFEGDVWSICAERMVTRVNNGSELIRDWVADRRYEPLHNFYPSNSDDEELLAYEACCALDMPLQEYMKGFNPFEREVSR